MGDLTIIYYTANKVTDYFYNNTKAQLLKAAGNIPIISVTQKPVGFGQNIVVGDIGQSVPNIYRQVLIGAKAAKTEFVAMAEDDTLYCKEHFNYNNRTPSKHRFLYNMNRWNLYTWSQPPIFSRKYRMVLNALIAPRELLIEALEERFAKYPKDEMIPLKYFAEPGRYETGLGVTIRETEKWYSDPPIVVFSHPEALNFIQQGERKNLGDERLYSLPYWGTAEEVLRNYTNEI